MGELPVWSFIGVFSIKMVPEIRNKLSWSCNKDDFFWSPQFSAWTSIRRFCFLKNYRLAKKRLSKVGILYWFYTWKISLLSLTLGYCSSAPYAGSVNMIIRCLLFLLLAEQGEKYTLVKIQWKRTLTCCWRRRIEYSTIGPKRNLLLFPVTRPTRQKAADSVNFMA